MIRAPRPSWWKRRIAWPLRRRFSRFAVGPSRRPDEISIRVRWWAWPSLVLGSAWRGMELRPRAAWAVVAPWLLLIGLRQSARALLGKA